MALNYFNRFVGACSISDITIYYNKIYKPAFIVFLSVTSCLGVIPLVHLLLHVDSNAWHFVHWWCNGIVVLAVSVNIASTLYVVDTASLTVAQVGVCVSIVASIFLPDKYQLVAAIIAFIATVKMAWVVHTCIGTQWCIYK